MSLLLKLKWAVSCRSLLGRNVSYYPDEPHKSRLRIIWDQCLSFLRHGYFEEFYYTYGFDRAEMTRNRMDAYITPYRSFLYRVDHLNFQNPYFDDYYGRMTGRVFNQDKFYFFLLLSRLGYPTPCIYRYVRKGQVLYEDPAFETDFDAVVKPVDGMMGHDIFFLCRRGGRLFKEDQPCSLEELDEIYASSGYIIQERVVQHADLAALCPTSVNTIRLYTVMLEDGQVIPFAPLLRIGRLGSLVDNWATGGIAVGIDAATGKLLARGVFKPGCGTFAFEHPETHVRFEGYPVPFYKEAEEMAVRLHRLMYRNHSIGWDIAITAQGPVIIEGNDRWEISIMQGAHGPLGYLRKYFQ